MHRLIPIALADLGVGPHSNRDELQRICENRWTPRLSDKYPIAYSWCGDYASYVLMLAGCRDGSALNRVAVRGSWKPGWNIEMLVDWAKAHGQWRKDSVDYAQQGCYVVLHRPNGDHIGLIEGVSISHIDTIDGNGWGGIVTRTHRERVNTPIRGWFSTDLLLSQGLPPPPPGTEVPPPWLPFPPPNPSVPPPPIPWIPAWVSDWLKANPFPSGFWQASSESSTLPQTAGLEEVISCGQRFIRFPSGMDLSDPFVAAIAEWQRVLTAQFDTMTTHSSDDPPIEAPYEVYSGISRSDP